MIADELRLKNARSVSILHQKQLHEAGDSNSFYPEMGL